MNILLLEDNATDADLTRRSLEHSFSGCKVEVAPTVKQAKVLLKKGIKFDIALLDMQLPDGTGLDLLTEIRLSGLKLPLIMITGSGNEEVATAVLKAGADDYIIKQQGYAENLAGIIDYVIKNYHQKIQELKEVIDVLYVEHHLSDIDLTQRHLKQFAPYIHIDFVATAEEALEKLSINKAETCKCKVILLDYRLPGINALEFIKIIRQERKLDVPIILVTGQGSEDVAIQALKLGANDYLVKRENYLYRLALAILNAHQHSELIKKQAIIVESEAIYRTMFANNPQPMWIYDLETLAFLEVNNAAIQHYGYTSEEFLSMSLKDIRPKEDIEALLRNIESTDNVYNIAGEWRHRKKNGELISVQIVSHTITFEGRAARHVLVQDITERKRAEEALMISEEKYRTIFENVQDVFYQTDMAGNILEISPSIKYFSEFQKDKLIGTPVSNLYFNPNDREILINTLMENGEIRDFEATLKTKSGEKKYVSINARLIFDSNGKPEHIDGAIRDISERKLAERQIRLLSRGIEQSPVTIIITDKNGDIEYVNPKFTELSGYTLEEVKGKNPRILQSGTQSIEFYKELWDSILMGNEWRGELHNKKKNGESYWESTVISSILDSQNDISHFIAVKEDISEKKKMVEDLIQAKEHAEESDRLKSAFLANMSHEIRTPLNSIIGFSELLGDDYFEQKQKQEFVQNIIVNGNNLLNIISDIIDISKIESGQITIRKSKVMVSKFLEEVRAQHVMKADEKGLTFKCVCHCDESNPDALILTDPERLRQIFNNLISNALKFTPEGQIEIGCKLIGNEVEFQVKDTGIGIPSEFHDVIFDRFRQVEGSFTRKYGGNGLGLAITKNLIELMGGKIWVESEPGKGSTFYFTLPRITEEPSK